MYCMILGSIPLYFLLKKLIFKNKKINNYNIYVKNKGINLFTFYLKCK